MAKRPLAGAERFLPIRRNQRAVRNERHSRRARVKYRSLRLADDPAAQGALRPAGVRRLRRRCRIPEGRTDQQVDQVDFAGRFRIIRQAPHRWRKPRLRHRLAAEDSGRRGAFRRRRRPVRIKRRAVRANSPQPRIGDGPRRIKRIFRSIREGRIAWSDQPILEEFLERRLNAVSNNTRSGGCLRIRQ